MKLTPLDIRKQEFKKVMRGFDPEEVEAFLGMVADEMELIIREKNSINDELIKLRTQLKDYQQVEGTLRETLVSAQNTVEESRVNSRREAEIIIHEAELQGEHIIKEAREDLMTLRHEISLIKTQKESFAKRLRHLLQSQIELLEVMEMDDDELDSPRRKKNDIKLRGRMPRQDEESEQFLAEKKKHESEKEEPVIIRGEDEEEFQDVQPEENIDQENLDLEASDNDKEEGGHKLSDQFIV